MKFPIYSWEISYSINERRSTDATKLYPHHEWVKTDSGKELIRAPTAADALTIWSANYGGKRDADGRVRKLEHIRLVDE